MVRDVTLYDYYPKQRLCLSGCWPSCLGQWYCFLFRSPPFSKWPKGEICDTWMCSGTGSVTNNLCFLDCKSEVSRTKRQLSSNIARDKDFILKNGHKHGIQKLSNCNVIKGKIWKWELNLESQKVGWPMGSARVTLMGGSGQRSE